MWGMQEPPQKRGEETWLQVQIKKALETYMEACIMDWVEEWKKRDPYFLDMEGYLKFVEQKERETQVSRYRRVRDEP